MINAQNLTKTFGSRTAVDDLSFTVDKGDVVGFLGPNGAGKTTTIRMLTGYLPPTRGTASIAGFDIQKESKETRRAIGYMPESVPLYDDMRVTEYLTFRGKIKGLSGRRLKERVAAVIELCGLGEMRKRIIKALSKGYRQRVGLADALVHEPELLILDEPTNGLDPNQIRGIRTLIKDLAKERTVMISTHILSEVEMTCNKVIIIDRGRIKAADRPENLVNSLRAAGSVILETQAAPDIAIPSLGQIEHVKKVRELSSSNNWNQYEILVDADTDAREKISKLCLEKSWDLRSLHRTDATLEDVFVELTRRD